MLTKAIILNRLQDNHYLIRIPILESPGDTAIFSIEATLAHTPGIIESYKEGDVVIVGFEDHSASNPIIIGKLFLEGGNEARGYAQVESLNVKESASLPDTLNIGGMEFKNVSQMLTALESTKEDILNSELPTIRVTSLSQGQFGDDNTITFDEGDRVYLNFYLTGGKLEVGDEVTLCERCKSINSDKRIRYRYKVREKRVITQSDVDRYKKRGDFSMTFVGQLGEDGGRIFRHNGTLSEGPAIRFIRLRRKIDDNKYIFSNIETVRFIVSSKNRFEHNIITMK